MNYKNQLVLTGQVNDVGEYTRKNISESSRAGVEAEAAFLFSDKFNAAFNITLSSNKINSHPEFIDTYDSTGNYIGQQKNDFRKTDIAFSPSVISAVILSVISTADISGCKSYVATLGDNTMMRFSPSNSASRPPEKKNDTCGYFSVSAIRTCVIPALEITSPMVFVKLSKLKTKEKVEHV